MSTDEHRALAASWLMMQRHRWAGEALHRQIKEAPHDAWLTLLCIVDAAADAAMLETIGAGPLEDLVRAHADALVASIEHEAQSNAKLRVALGHVWVRRGPGETVRRLLALGCVPIVPPP